MAFHYGCTASGNALVGYIKLPNNKISPKNIQNNKIKKNNSPKNLSDTIL